MIAYISGHLDLTEDEFNTHYKDWIDRAILIGDSFVIGDAKGADWLAQNYLAKNYISLDRVKIYHMFTKPRHHTVWWLLGGFKSDEERDAAMTSISDYDIAWVRPGRENSGTAKNLDRRKKLVMNNTKVVHCKHSIYDIYIGRPSVWGNPFEIGQDGTREEVIEKYRQWLLTQPNLMLNLHLLKGKRLGCWCKPKACHGDVLKELCENYVN